MNWDESIRKAEYVISLCQEAKGILHPWMDEWSNELNASGLRGDILETATLGEMIVRLNFVQQNALRLHRAASFHKEQTQPRQARGL